MADDDDWEVIPERSWSGWRYLLGISLIIFSIIWIMAGLYIMYFAHVCLFSGVILFILGGIALGYGPDDEYD